MKLKALVVGAALAAAASIGTPVATNAAVVVSLNGFYVAFPNIVPAFGPGPDTFGGSSGSLVTWTSTNVATQGGSVFGDVPGYGFGSNGSFIFNPSNPRAMAGLNDANDYYGVTDTMTFTFSEPISAVGGIINWVPSNAPVTIAAYDASNNLIESLTLSSGGVNLETPDSFYGFSESTADIAKLTLTDGYVGVIGGLTLVGPNVPIPEPATWGLMLIGLFGLGATLRSRRSPSATLA